MIITGDVIWACLEIIEATKRWFGIIFCYRKMGGNGIHIQSQKQTMHWLLENFTWTCFALFIIVVRRPTTITYLLPTQSMQTTEICPNFFKTIVELAERFDRCLIMHLMVPKYHLLPWDTFGKHRCAYDCVESSRQTKTAKCNDTRIASADEKIV